MKMEHRIIKEMAAAFLRPKEVTTPIVLLYGVVSSEQTDGTLTVAISGAAPVPGIKKALNTPTPIGATVLILKNGGDHVVLDTPSKGKEWVDFTPAWQNVTLGTSFTSYGHYRRSGNWLEYKCGFVLGTGGVLTGLLGMLCSDLPNALSAHDQVSAYCYANDVSAGLRYSAVANTAQGTNTYLSRVVSAGVQGWAAAAPFTWAAGDSFHATGTVILD